MSQFSNMTPGGAQVNRCMSTGTKLPSVQHVRGPRFDAYLSLVADLAIRYCQCHISYSLEGGITFFVTYSLAQV